MPRAGAQDSKTYFEGALHARIRSVHEAGMCCCARRSMHAVFVAPTLSTRDPVLCGLCDNCAGAVV